MALPNGNGSLPRKNRPLSTSPRNAAEKLDVDTELTGFGQTVAQAAAGQAVQALGATARIVFGVGLQFGFAFDVAVEEFGAHAALQASRQQT